MPLSTWTFLKTSSAIGVLAPCDAWPPTRLALNSTQAAVPAMAPVSDLDTLLPTVHGFALQRIRTELGELDSQTVRVGHVREDCAGERARARGVAGHRSALSKRFDRRLHVLDMQSEMVDTGGAARAGVLVVGESGFSSSQV